MLKSVDLFHSGANAAPILAVQEAAPYQFLVTSGQTTVGEIIMFKDRMCLRLLDNRMIYSAVLVSADKGYESVDLSNLAGLYYDRELQFNLLIENGRRVGQYFVALHNIDLTHDKNMLYDRHIAVLFAVVIEEVLVKSIKPPKVMVYR